MRRLPAWILLLLLGGCSLHPPLRLDPGLSAQLPPQRELSATPFFVQAKYQCGPAALAMVLDAYGRDLQPDQLTPWVFTPDAKGSFPAEMDAVARQQGFISYPVANFADLLREVDAGHPVLVLQNLGTSWYTQWHFAVVVGFDQARRELILRSGDLPRRRTGFTLFDTTWARSERWARVILPPDRLPATADPLRYLKAASDLEQTSPVTAAQQAFATAVGRWPEHPVARFGLANSLLKSGQPEAARQQFEILLQQHPDMASAWNNYAYALQALHCPASAQQAIRCAATRAPDDVAVADSLRELATTAPDGPGCRALACPAAP